MRRSWRAATRCNRPVRRSCSPRDYVGHRRHPRPVPALGRLVFAPPPPVAPAVEAKPKRAARPKVKNDPRLVAAARELRDRWLEQVNAGDAAALPAGRGKYEVSRAIEGALGEVTAKGGHPHAPVDSCAITPGNRPRRAVA